VADLAQIPRQALAQWRALRPRARGGIIAATLAAAVAVAVVAITAGHVDWAPLFSGLSSEDAGAITEKLREARVPFKLSPGGDAIEVPRDKVAETRITLASSGLPRGGGVGFELLEKQPLGVSEYMQHLQHQRALQGELERSIITLSAVQRARVHLVVPEKSLFRTPEQQASASVVLQLRPGRQLQAPQVQGIVHLVAASVEGLQPERVTGVDQRGEVLSQKSGSEAVASAALSFQREVEQTAAHRAQELLEKTLGQGHAAVQVSAQIDASRVESTDEKYDPEGQVLRSEQEVDDVVGASGETEGVAGARANLPGGPPPQVAGGAGSRRKSATRNFEIGKLTRKVTQPVARLQRLTVAVLVDGTYKGEGKERAFTTRPKEELDAYSAIVKEAVGFDERRGDQLEVRCVPFAPAEETFEMSSVAPATPSWAYAALAAAAILLGGVAFLAGRRNKVHVLPGMHLPAAVGELQASLGSEPRALPAGGAERQGLGPSPQQARQQALEALHGNPDRAVHILRAWLNDSDDDPARDKAKDNDRRALEPHRT
jgi:flagellar M-ring protein FliF